MSAERTFSQTTADTITRFQGTWRYLGLLTLPVTAWLVRAHDIAPGYWLLNLAVSLLGTYMPSIVLMSQNRQNDAERSTLAEVKLALEALNDKLDGNTGA